VQHVYIHLKSGSLVKDFTEALTQLDGGFEIRSGRATLDARSILGLYSLDLSKPLMLCMEKGNAQNLMALERFILDGDIAANF
jgi:hypothetical protein